MANTLTLNATRSNTTLPVEFYNPVTKQWVDGVQQNGSDAYQVVLTGIPAGTYSALKCRLKGSNPAIEGTFTQTVTVLDPPGGGGGATPPAFAISNVAVSGRTLTLTISTSDAAESSVDGVSFVDGLVLRNVYPGTYSTITARKKGTSTKAVYGQSVTVAQPNFVKLKGISDGNSLMFGYMDAGGQNNGITQKIKDALAAQLRLNNVSPTFTYDTFAVPGQTIEDMLTDQSSQVFPAYDSSQQNFLLVWEGTNALCNESLSVQQVYLDTRQYCEQSKAAHPEVPIVLATVLPRSNADTPASHSQRRHQFNALLYADKAAGLAWFDALADVGGDGRIGQDGQSEDTTYYNDKVHLNPLGGTIAAQIFANAIMEALYGVAQPAAYVMPVNTENDNNNAGNTQTGEVVAWAGFSQAAVQDDYAYPTVQYQEFGTQMLSTKAIRYTKAQQIIGFFEFTVDTRRPNNRFNVGLRDAGLPDQLAFNDFRYAWEYGTYNGDGVGFVRVYGTFSQADQSKEEGEYRYFPVYNGDVLRIQPEKNLVRWTLNKRTIHVCYVSDYQDLRVDTAFQSSGTNYELFKVRLGGNLVQLNGV